MRVLLVGGTGYIGQRLGQSLVAAGHEVITPTRDLQRAKRSLSYPAQLVPFDEVLAGTEDLGIDAVVNLAGEGIADRRWSDERKAEILASRVDLTKALGVRLARQTQKLSAWIQASAIGFYGDRGADELNESSAPGSGFLSEVCQKWEAALDPRLAHRTIVFRVGVVLGRECSFLKALEPIWSRGLGGPLSTGAQWLSWIHVDDLVGMIMTALQDSSWVGPVNAVAPESVSNLDWTKRYAKARGFAAVAPTPGWALRLVLGEMAEVALGSQRVLPKRAVEYGYRFLYPGIDQALAQIFSGVGPGESIRSWEAWVPRAVADIFPFFTDEKNLERLTPEILHFSVLGKSTAEIGEGTLIDYKLRVHGLPVRWRTEILNWDPPRQFVDNQIKGPYKRWHHTHEFVPLGGGTLLRDTVRFGLPLGILGRVSGGWLVERDVEAIFSYRAEVIRSLFG